MAGFHPPTVARSLGLTKKLRRCRVLPRRYALGSPFGGLFASAVPPKTPQALAGIGGSALVACPRPSAVPQIREREREIKYRGVACQLFKLKLNTNLNYNSSYESNF